MGQVLITGPDRLKLLERATVGSTESNRIIIKENLKTELTNVISLCFWMKKQALSTIVLQLSCHNKSQSESLSMEQTNILLWNIWMNWFKKKNLWPELNYLTIMGSLLSKDQKALLSSNKFSLTLISLKSHSCLTSNPNLKVMNMSSQGQATLEKTDSKSQVPLLKSLKSLKDYLKILSCNGLDLVPETP